MRACNSDLPRATCGRTNFRFRSFSSSTACGAESILLLNVTPLAASQAMYSRSICKSSVTFWRLRWYFWVPAGMFVQAGNGFVLKMYNGVSMTLLFSMFSAVSPPTSANLFEPPLLRLLTVRSYEPDALVRFQSVEYVSMMHVNFLPQAVSKLQGVGNGDLPLGTFVPRTKMVCLARPTCARNGRSLAIRLSKKTLGVCHVTISHLVRGRPYRFGGSCSGASDHLIFSVSVKPFAPRPEINRQTSESHRNVNASNI